ncbi:MAG TPA: YifB family Mg chelatase-like AAA ATPase [Candidatus Sulfotelmatobacter sp.]|nr:YifB family Mg chelatase-like AAA ATPase [Candidatus Sulfotelmatobacter sp.]
MIALAFSAAVAGVDAYVVQVETDSAAGVPAFGIVGLPDRALNESRDRVRAAIVNSGFGFPPGRLLVNLAPADMRKTGVGFDLPIALALLATDEQVPAAALRAYVACGELALDGGVRAVPGVLAMTLAAKRAGFSRVLVAEANRDEAALVDGIDVYAVPGLAEAVAVVLENGARFRRRGATVLVPDERPACGDYLDVRGQVVAKRALEIAAAGGHNLVLVGPPGCGKTMLARRLPSILPAMTSAEALDVTSVYSVAGLLGARPRVVTTRPFRAPHHTASRVALIGGGSNPRPGEVSLAQHGVLYLDELAEFTRSTLEVLRQPLEEGTVTIARAAGTLSFPARFMLVASMNPCPCGFRGVRGSDCHCDDAVVQRYLGKLSGPLLDRIDLHVAVSRVSFDELTDREAGESSATIRARVEAARGLQTKRYERCAYATNASIPAADMRVRCPLEADALALLEGAVSRGTLSARAFDRVARLARTIADLAGSARIERTHVAEALVYRGATARTPAAA